MGFDKTKAMRNAERYLAQGKIRSAINEYKQVVEHDPKDFGTMNLLGDLYSKASEPKSAVTYYTIVAEHYSKQGFNQKAIAVYNKIAKIQPNSTNVSEKLAELYKTKGSVKEAKSHYVVLAESYQAKGRTTEALAMWKQIAVLDPNNADVYPTIAELHLGLGEDTEASEAYADAGKRYISCGRAGDAVESFNRALGLDFNNSKALTGLIDAAAASGNVDAAIEQLRALYEENRGQTNILAAIVDAHVKANDANEAEKMVVKLVEQDPASYSKLVDVANHYLAKQDFDAATRMLSMASEHMLAGGQAESFAGAVQAVLTNRPEQLEALRLYVRFYTWQRDEAGLKESLQNLALVARKENSVDDERFALSQLVLLMPQDAGFAERLREINAIHGFEDEVPAGQGLFDQRFYKTKGSADPATAPVVDAPIMEAPADFEIVGAVIESSNGEIAFEVQCKAEPECIEEVESFEVDIQQPVADESPADRLRREAESIKFYIDNGYTELAQKAIIDLEADFGSVPEIAELRSYMGSQETIEDVAAAAVSEPAQPALQTNSGLFDLGELRSELGLEEPEPVDDSDYETKYQTAVAYQEMGLLEQAIAEFQDAAALVGPNDGTRRFFNCANLLGLCFMESGMPKLAMKWYQRALEIKNLNSDERLALWYELGIAFDAEGEHDEAERYFEQVYAENVDYRDVRSRVKNLVVTH